MKFTMKYLTTAFLFFALLLGGQSQALSLAPPLQCETLAQMKTEACQIRSECGDLQDRLTKLVGRQWELSNAPGNTFTLEDGGSVTVFKTTTQIEERLARIAARIETVRGRLDKCTVRALRKGSSRH